MLLERDGIELARDFVAFVFGRLELRFLGGFPGEPVEELPARAFVDRRALHLFAHRVDEPQTIFLPELRAEPKSVLAMPEARGIVRRAAQAHFRLRTGPFLIHELRRVQHDGVVETRAEAWR